MKPKAVSVLLIVDHCCEHARNGRYKLTISIILCNMLGQQGIRLSIDMTNKIEDIVSNNFRTELAVATP
jgi:hypothetical protein